mmetsp:Transcript_3215/g.3814  ORF Transcript_3215/g.3814 Transcript_3215/m.3814 type:complete len:285 (+) Transcript_3215:92-946(+)
MKENTKGRAHLRSYNQDCLRGFLGGVLLSLLVSVLMPRLSEEPAKLHNRIVEYTKRNGENRNGYLLGDYFPREEFKGSNLWETEKTKYREVLFETSRLRIERHEVEINTKRINDWLFVEIPNQINVLVEHKGKFLVFNQTKYGLKGHSLAPVGGYIEPGETSFDAARREVNEELKMSVGSLHYLGEYRVDVNRGCGIVSLFLATNCKKLTRGGLESDDLEAHDLKRLSTKEIAMAYGRFAFREVKWTATVGLSLSAIQTNKTVYDSMSSDFKEKLGAQWQANFK